MRIIPAKFQPTIFKIVGGNRGERQTGGQMDEAHYRPDPFTKFLNILPSLERDNSKARQGFS